MIYQRTKTKKTIAAGTSSTIDISANFVHLAEGPASHVLLITLVIRDGDSTRVICKGDPRASTQELTKKSRAHGKELRDRVTDQKARNLPTKCQDMHLVHVTTI